ncbi:MAG: Gfo/Idh/MocA family oxidoreductase [Fibrobacterota bacterium]
MKPVTYIIAGAGGRGQVYAEYALGHPEQAKVIGVAEPNEALRDRMVKNHSIPKENIFTDWAAMAARPKFADAVIIATQDKMHEAPAIAFAEKGYAMLLEKPMAPTEAGCRNIVEAALRHNILFAVCHVLRYTRYTQALKTALNAGVIGDIVSIQHMEPVGFWHQAHSFVRGNWRNEAKSSPMLLAKSCHDLDWMRYIMGRPCEALSSFGSLCHFRKSEKPKAAGNAMRCIDCAYEAECPYSAKKIYLRDKIQQGKTGWPVNVITLEPTEATVLQALKEGPYGRCVYECDNDVVDHQVVSMQFEGGRTGSFTMTAFSQLAGRRTRIFGTRGEISVKDEDIECYEFMTDKWRKIELPPPPASPQGHSGHAGGDYELMKHFTAAVAANDPGKVLSGPQETLETHRMVFAAETARREGRVVRL